MNAGRICSKAVVLFGALCFCAVASANWQVSSTDQRLLKLLDPDKVPARFARAGIPAGAIVDMGPRCTVIFNAGHVALADYPGTLRLPRGTLEMFIDHDTAAYRNSGLSSMNGGNDTMFAPAIQFHRLSPRGSSEISTPQPDKTIVEGQQDRPIGWSPDSVYDFEQDPITVPEPQPPLIHTAGNSRIYYLLRSKYTMAQFAGMTSLVLPPTSPLGNEVTSANADSVQLDAADRQSSYWIDYDMEVLNTLRTSDGAVSLRVYFPGYIANAQTGMNPEHPHYVNWSVDMGMMESDANEVFTKLESCANQHEIDGKWTPAAVDS
jgi:hypothetical protein